MAENDARLLIVLEAKIDKLQSSLSKANSAIALHGQHVEKTLQKTDQQWSKLFQRAEPGKAIEAVFSRSRLGLIEEGGTKIGLFGSALEHLGGVGLVSAAGIAAAGVAVEQVVKAAEFSENLEKTAKAIGITTTALQEYDFIALASGLSTDTFRQSLQGLNEKIGLVQSGVAGPKVKKVFDALGISAEQLRNLGDVEHILPVIADKLAALPAAERAGLAARLDIAPILPALLKGSAGLADLTQQAHKLGVVLDEDVVKRSAEAAEKMKIAADVIDKNLKAAFAGLAPAIADVVTQLTQVLVQLSKIGAFKLPADLNLGNVELASVQATAGDYVGAAKTLLSGSEKNRLKRLNVNTVTTADILARLGIHDDGGKPHELVHGTAKAGPRDDTEERLASANEAAANAARALAEAQKALTQDIDERAVFELAAARDEADAKKAALDKQLASLLKDKGIEGADSDKAQAQIEAAQRDVAAAYEAKAEAIRRQADAERDEAAVRFKQRVDDYYQRVAAIQSQLADTAADRLAIDKRDLEHRQELEREALQTENANAVANGSRTQDQADRLTEGLAAQQGAERAGFVDAHLTPLQAYLENMRKAAADTDTAFSQLAVDGLTTFNDGLIEAIVNFKSLGDVGRSVLRALEADLLRILLNKAESAIFSGLLGGLFGVPGFADGTDYAPGGLAIVGERGPELVGLPRGSQVTPNHELMKSLGRINTAGVTSGGGATVINHTFELHSPVVTQDLINQMRAYSMKATQDAVALSKAGLSTQLRQRRLLND